MWCQIMEHFPLLPGQKGFGIRAFELVTVAATSSPPLDFSGHAAGTSGQGCCCVCLVPAAPVQHLWGSHLQVLHLWILHP